MRITSMTVDNVKEVEKLEAECFDTPWSLDSLVEELSNPMAIFRVAYLDDTLVGYAGMHHIIDEGYLTNVAVSAAHRRRGVARALLEELIGYGEENDLRTISLEVRPSNEAAISLYRDLDFEDAGRRKDFYRNPTEDALILTCKL